MSTNIVKKLFKKLKYLFNAEESSKEGIEEQKAHKSHRKQIENGKCKSNYISITSNVNKLNNSIKRQRLLEQINHDLPVCCLQKIHFRFKDTGKLKVKNGKRYIIETATRKLYKYQEIDFKTKKKVTR